MDIKFGEVFKRPLTRAELEQLGKTDLVELVTIFQVRENLFTQALQGVAGIAERLAEMTVGASKRLSRLLDLMFRGSLKSTSAKRKKKKKDVKKPPESGKQLPSERYPQIPITKREIKSPHPPQCGCGQEMVDSGLRETTERLEVQPKQFYIVRDERVTYTCKSCDAGIATAPAQPQIIQGSCYGDSFVKDVVLSKLCDLVPITRYVAIAERQGVAGIPANSLHDFSRHLGIFLDPSYKRLLRGIKQSPDPMLADETRHMMLEGSEKKSWYLWSFNGPSGVCLRIEDSRAGDVAADFLKGCECIALMSDAYRGYGKALRIVNEMREKAGCPAILQAFCNAHARNNFQANAIKNARISRRIVWIYRIIFVRYRDYKIHEGEEFEKVKALLERCFLTIKQIAEREMPNLSEKSALYDALEYFLTYYKGLTLFLSDRSIPMHNNRSEGTLRNSVIGRKTWLGTHSIESAKNIAKIMSLIESCKLLGTNPREYVDDAVERVHKGQPALSPYEYWKMQTADSS